MYHLKFDSDEYHIESMILELIIKKEKWILILAYKSPNDNDNDNDNILFDHNVPIEITIFNSLENHIINRSGDYYLDKLICHYHNALI